MSTDKFTAHDYNKTSRQTVRLRRLTASCYTDALN
jgi:hypothetical protein